MQILISTYAWAIWSMSLGRQCIQNPRMLKTRRLVGPVCVGKIRENSFVMLDQAKDDEKLMAQQTFVRPIYTKMGMRHKIYKLTL